MASVVVVCYHGLSNWVTLWCLMPISTIFQLYRGVSFIDGVNQRKPTTCRESLTNFITYCYIEYTWPWTGFKLTI